MNHIRQDLSNNIIQKINSTNTHIHHGTQLHTTVHSYVQPLYSSQSFIISHHRRFQCPKKTFTMKITHIRSRNTKSRNVPVNANNTDTVKSH